jgi:hypothetical protein
MDATGLYFSREEQGKAETPPGRAEARKHPLDVLPGALDIISRAVTAGKARQGSKWWMPGTAQA